MADFIIKAHDTLPSVSAALSTGGAPLDLTSASAVEFVMRLVGGAVKVTAPATVTDSLGGAVRYDWVPADTSAPGEYQAEWQVTWASGGVQTFPTATYHTITVVPDLDGA